MFPTQGRSRARVALDVAENEIRYLIGANGAGKTTLLNAIMASCRLKARPLPATDMAPLDIEDRRRGGLSLVPSIANCSPP